MADSWVAEDGALIFVENHCPICAAAAACAGVCRSELETFQKVLGAQVVRQEHILLGARRCAYRVVPLANTAPAARRSLSRPHRNLQAEGAYHTRQGFKGRIAAFAEGFVKCLATDTGILCQLCHAAGPGQITDDRCK